jgi:hypothetical protein
MGDYATPYIVTLVVNHDLSAIFVVGCICLSGLIPVYLLKETFGI